MPVRCAPAATPATIAGKPCNAAALSKPELKEMLANQLLTLTLSKSSRYFTELEQKETRERRDFIHEYRIKIE